MKLAAGKESLFVPFSSVSVGTVLLPFPLLLQTLTSIHKLPESFSKEHNDVHTERQVAANRSRKPFIPRLLLSPSSSLQMEPLQLIHHPHAFKWIGRKHSASLHSYFASSLHNESSFKQRDQRSLIKHPIKAILMWLNEHLHPDSFVWCFTGMQECICAKIKYNTET